MQDDLSNSVISRVALVVKRMYCLLRCRAQRIDDYNPPEHKYGKIWRNAALICIQHRINPAEFVEVQFYCIKPYPELTHIIDKRALERYRDHGEEYAASYAVDFNIQLQVYERLIEIGRAPKEALTGDQHFDPLFTYSVAVVNGLGELVREVEEDALVKYLTSVHHDQLYRDIVPDKFKITARKIWEGIDANGLGGCPAAASAQGS